VLDAALENNLDAPFPAKQGSVSTCICKVTEGEVEHAVEPRAWERLREVERRVNRLKLAKGYPLERHAFH